MNKIDAKTKIKMMSLHDFLRARMPKALKKGADGHRRYSVDGDTGRAWFFGKKRKKIGLMLLLEYSPDQEKWILVRRIGYRKDARKKRKRPCGQ